MTEVEIVNHISALYDRYWVMVQWWASLSFGLIAVAHLAADRLTAYLLSLILILYLVYSVWMLNFYLYNLYALDGFLSDLGVLRDSTNLSSGSLAYLEGDGLGIGLLLQNIAMTVTFLGCIAYLVYSFVNRRNGTAK